MAKIKKLLCMALAVAMVASLFCISASAEANWSHSFDMSAMMGSGDYGRHGTTTTADYNVAGVYGKGADGVLKLEGGTDYYLGLSGNDSRYTFSANSRTVISYDVAFDSLENSGNNHVSLIQFANTSGASLGQLNLVQITKDGAINPLDKGNVSTSAKVGCWNNITAVIDLGADSKAYSCTIYFNGEAIKSVEGTLSAETAYVRVLRICDRTEGGVVYVDNLKFASYPSSDEVNLAFTTTAAATEGNETLINAENKTINLTNIEMTVADFKAATTGFIVLGEDGAIAADDAYIANSEVYAVYVNGSNSYYDKYEVAVEPPVIEGANANFKEIVDSEKKEIRLVDRPYLTVGEFLANTTGATVTLADGTPAPEEAFLADCRVSAVLGTIYDIEYTLVKARSYALENETFDGTFSKRTSGNGKIYAGNGIEWNGQTNGKTGITFDEAAGLGGKAETDKSLSLTADNVSAAGDVFMYLNNPYSVSKTVLANTFTIEGKLFIDGVDATDIDSIDIVVCNRRVAKLMPDGSVRRDDNVASKYSKWSNGNWIPFGITYHKATNRVEVYVGGANADIGVTGAPGNGDIRFRPMLKEGASFTLAIDDVKLYTDSIETVKYTISENTVTMTKTFNLSGEPILAVYGEDGLAAVKVGTNNTVSASYEEGQIVRAFLWGKDSAIGPWTGAVTVVDRETPVNARTATLSKAFTDNMVLQSNMPVTVWGTSADPNGSALLVELGTESKMAYVNNGAWEVAFDAREAGVTEKLTVETKTQTTTIKNIVYGDVYFVGGQSNAYLPMNTVDTYQQDKASFTEDDNIRIFHQVGNYSAEAQKNPISGSKWEYATESTIGKMSAIGMYFAKTLRESGVDTPIGLISVARNGSSLHWNIPKSITDKYQITYMTDKTNQAYNALMAPVEKFAAKGMLWYQGENDSIKGSVDVIGQATEIYDDMFSDFHTYMKEKTGNDDFKIFAVQLSSHPSEQMLAQNPTTGWQLPQFRAYQYDIMKAMEDVYVVPSQDCGYRKDDDDPAHPNYKKPIGERLAKAALYAIYNKETENNALCPMPESVSYDGSTVTITFKNTAAGLKKAVGEELKGFELIDENGNAVEATAVIEGTNKVVVTNSSISEAKGVRYAFYRAAAQTIANLVDSNGMPCPTFANDKGAANGKNTAKVPVLSEGVMLGE